jgi:predicted RNase H-like nuclease (RuvC/YqgF family)
MGKDEGTVLHEIQMLERQLDRLMPSLEKLNTRISAMEADVQNLKDKIKELREHDTELYDNRNSTGKKIVSIEKDVEQVEEDVAALAEALEGLNSEAKKDRRVWAGRIWHLFELVFAALIGGLVTFYVAKAQLGLGKEKPKPNAVSPSEGAENVQP